jgi:hypothetical protein
MIFSLDLGFISLIGIGALMLFEYTAVGQGHSRYGAPLFMLSPFLLMFILNNRKNLFENLRVRK